ncbi:TonB-dependent receptor plug domain-containing protein [Pseudoxanthomonas sacheonensis]|uniref:Outer membrane receptor protein involved in Fe transport n=1 Tax=Pseudoxanthomonas sacheonensis TaxID=443615 RepID=A0ABU1RVP7_9GAMM|nr:TonB-dependent receptor [Pseudoxanthomonas sacheonensis]MDR6842851.1 outer membrane receptor protein involved in Fe transport [Pseudoxanthomonas sacheonensis]
MDRKLLATAICAALAWSLAATAVRAQEVASTEAKADDDATELDRVLVTGSRIPRAQLETASPVITITAEDIQRQGFRNVSDVLRAQPLATGAVQDNQYAGSFTSNATTISLLGLSPSFTLILMDGRPLADYPLLYNGQSNFTDLTSIPTAMVERIEILPGNQSSIYGSAAIAGVVNIILKKRLDGMQLDARVGGYSDGGGDNERLQLTGGKAWDNLDITYGLQYSHQDPIYMRQRDFTDTTDDNPNPGLRYGSRTFIILNGFTGQYDDPGAGCDNVAANFDGTTQRDFRPGRGFFCGSRAQPGYATLLNEEKGISAYFNSNYRMGDNANFYASVLYGKNEAKNDSGSRFWIPNYNDGTDGYIWNQTEQTLETYQHIFSPEEQGITNFTTDSTSYNIALGVNGTIADSNWDYDVYYSRSGYEVKSDQLWPLVDEMDAFFQEQFLGPQLGTYYGYPVYEPNKPAFYQSITPEQFRAFSGNLRNTSSTWTHNFNVQLTNPDLFQLPAGSVGVAGVFQLGYQHWDNPVDPGVSGDDYFGLSGTSGSGNRANRAVGVEFSIPLLKSLTASVSGRYDSYKNIRAGSDAKATYKLGLEFRPIDSLLLRANYATAFRAPDMGYVFTGGNGFFSSQTDYYKCETYGPNPDCPFEGLSLEGVQVANPDLKSITAKSYGFGFVWSPSDRYELRADYYNVRIEDEVLPQSFSRTLFDENECRQGRLDINSPTCVDALSRIQRGPLNANPLLSESVQLVTIKAINIAEEQISGITAGGSARFDWGRWGEFGFGLDYNLTLDHTTVTFPGDPETDLLSPQQALSAEFKSVLTGDISWQKGDWSANVHGIRYGSTPNYAAQFGVDTTPGTSQGRVGPHMLYNMSVSYDLTEKSALSLTVNNVLNTKPPFDPTYDGSQGFAPPFYNIFAYNGYGRAFWVQYRIDFGTNN